MIYSNLTPKQLKAWRLKKGWSISFVARKIGRAHDFVWRYENMEDKIPLYAALLFATVDKDIEPLNFGN